MVKVINNYTLIEKIGEGNYGEVYRSLNTKKLGEFAVKIIPIQKFQQNNLLQQCTINQVKTLSTIGPCQYIVKYQDHFQTRNNYYFVYEYCNGGTLLEALRKQGTFQQKKALTIFRQLLEAFKVLNRFNIMHRDIKPQNIFFSNGKVKLGDFGFCKGLKPGQHMAKTMLGSPIYMAPQVLRGQNYTMKADIWSLGVVLYEMLFGVCPFQSNSIAMLITTINTKDLVIPLQMNPISQKTQSLLKKLLTKDYFRRISWVQLFGYKIDETGTYIENDANTKSPYNSSNKSISAIRDGCDIKFHDGSYTTTNKKPASVPKQAKLKFYSEKYMSAFNQPMLTTTGKKTQRKISLFTQNLLQKFNLKQETAHESFQGAKTNSDTKIYEMFKSPNVQESKRSKLMKRHLQCLNILKQTLQILQKRQIQSLGISYLSLTKVHQKLKYITQDIKVSQTDLLDLASLINYQIIQVDRQIIQTKQEMLRRKLPIPKEQRELNLISQKSIEQNSSFLQANGFFTHCNTQQNN